MAPKSLINPRKKPRQARAEATVAAIVEAAAHILAAEGLAGLNTNAVAKRAGVSIGSLYQYYPTKEAILTDLLRRKRARMLEDFDLAFAQGERFEEKAAIRLFAEVAIRNQARAPKLAQALEYANAALPLDEETRRTDSAIIKGVAAFLEARSVPQPAEGARDITALTRGMMNDAFRQDDVCEAALADRITMAICGYMAELRRAATK